MKRNTSSISDSKLDIVITEQQLEQIFEAIVSGKYSWACVLMLRFAKYNPLDYIPSRTYSRLIKDNRSNPNAKKLGTTSDQFSARQNTLLQDYAFFLIMRSLNSAIKDRKISD